MNPTKHSTEQEEPLDELIAFKAPKSLKADISRAAATLNLQDGQNRNFSDTCRAALIQFTRSVLQPEAA
jgi:hypothetical protein